MNLMDFAEQTQIWPRLRRAMLIFWLPLVLLAVIPVAIVLFASISSSVLWIILNGFTAAVITNWLEIPNTWRFASVPAYTRSFFWFWWFVLTILLGIAGAFTATFIGESMGWFRLDQGAGHIGAMIGALIFLFIWNQVVRQVIRARAHHRYLTGVRRRDS